MHDVVVYASSLPRVADRSRKIEVLEAFVAGAQAQGARVLLQRQCEVVPSRPAICLGPNAAGVVCSQTLSDVESPRVPTDDEREAWLRHLSYSQFTFAEMADGTAWRILNQL